MDTLNEIQERADAVKDIEKQLLALHQVGLGDGAVGGGRVGGGRVAAATRVGEGGIRTKVLGLSVTA